MKKTIIFIIAIFLFWSCIFSVNSQEYSETANAPSWNTQSWNGLTGFIYLSNDTYQTNLTDVIKVATELGTQLIISNNVSNIYFTSAFIGNSVNNIGLVLNISTSYFIGIYKPACVVRTNANDVDLSGTYPIKTNLGTITSGAYSVGCLSPFSIVYTTGDGYSIDYWNVTIIGITPPSLTINHNLINKTNVSLTSLFEYITYNGTAIATSEFFNCSLLVSRNGEDFIINETQLNVNITQPQYFNYSYGFIDGYVNFRINCTNSDINEITDIYTYNVDTSTYINYMLGLENLNKNELIWGEIDMIWIILFIALFMVLGIVTRIYSLWVIAGFGFYLISFKTTIIDTPYTNALLYGGLFIGSGIMLLGVIAQLLIIADNKKQKTKPSIFDDINYN